MQWSYNMVHSHFTLCLKVCVYLKQLSQHPRYGLWMRVKGPHHYKVTDVDSCGEVAHRPWRWIALIDMGFVDKWPFQKCKGNRFFRNWTGRTEIIGGVRNCEFLYGGLPLPGSTSPEKLVGGRFINVRLSLIMPNTSWFHISSLDWRDEKEKHWSVEQDAFLMLTTKLLAVQNLQDIRKAHRVFRRPSGTTFL